MSAAGAAAAADAARGGAGTRALPHPGLEAVWAHPVLGRLLRGHGRLQAADRRWPWLLDTWITVAVVLIVLPDLLDSGGYSVFPGTERTDLPPAALLALGAGLSLPLLARRRAPGVAFFTIAAATLVEWYLGVWVQVGISLPIALYSLALYGSPRVLGWAAALTATELCLAGYVIIPGDLPGDRPLGWLFPMVGTALGAIALGLIFRIRWAYVAALEDRAARLEIERDQRVRLTAAAERSRVAREMHDIVGHNLSVIVGLADGGTALAAGRNERTAEALRIIGDTGRHALGELRRVLGVLRDEAEDVQLSPQPGISDLDALVARVRAAGLTVTYRTAGGLDDLGKGVQLAVYRIVQEALTNTLKHAGAGSAARVTVAAEEGRVLVRVADSGPPADARTHQAPRPGPPGPPGTGAPTGEPGHGVVGIRQRAAMYGGSVTLGPAGAGDGWVVEVVLDAPPPAPVAPVPGEQAS